MASKTILFVDDDSFVLTMYRSRLQVAGFHVEVAGDGLAAIDRLPRIRPDLVVLDLMLPKLHGLEVLKFIRSDVNLKATPVVVLSNAYMEGLATKAMEAGANAGILKTQCTPATLLKIIRDQFGSGSSKKGQPSGAGDSALPAEIAAEALSEKTCCESARAELLRSAPQEIAKIRQESLAFVKMGGSPASADHLNGLYRRVRFFSARAGMSGCTKITELSGALEALLFEIGFKLSRATPSVLQTIAQAVDCLAHLVQEGDIAGGETSVKRKVLVVDDDEICSYAIVAALKRAHFDPASVQDPKAALAMLQRSPFDLVLLDINMPGMDGFEVCEQLRRIPHHQTTPVIFVTLHGEFQNRARSVLSGGNDLITKPISPIELTLKVTIHLLQAGGQTTAALPEADVAKDQAEEPRNMSAAYAPGEPLVDELNGHIPQSIASLPVDQPREGRFCAEENLTAAGSAKAGANGKGCGMPTTGSLSSRKTNGALTGESCEREQPGNATVLLQDIPAGRSNGSAEPEDSVERLRCENEDLRTSTKDLFAELARVNERLKKALTENEYAVRRLESLTEEHNTTQDELRQRRKAEEELRSARRELEQKAQGQAAELERLTAALKAEQAAFLGLEKAKAEQALAQTRLQQELEQHARRAEQWQQQQKALEERLQAETREREQLSEQLAAARQLGEQAHGNGEADERKQWSQRVAELEQARTMLEQQIKEHAEREKNLLDKCGSIEEQLKRLNESQAESRALLAQEARHRAAAEDQARELTRLRASLLEQLGQRVRTEKQLRRDLKELQARLDGKAQVPSVDRSELEAKIQELQAARAMVTQLEDKCAEVEAQLKGIKESLMQNQAQLSQEAERRATAEDQANQIAALQSSLQQELTQRTEAGEQLRRELEEQKARLQVQDETLSEDRRQLEAKVQELQTAKATLAELQDKCAVVETQLKGVTKSLAQNQAQISREAEFRAAAESQASELAGLCASLERELAQRTTAEEQLRRKWEEKQTRLQTELETIAEQRRKLESKTQELETAQTTVANLRDKCAAAEEQLKRLNESQTEIRGHLAQEAKRRALAEDQASQFATVRSSLERKLAQRTKAEEQLRRDLEGQKARLQSQGLSLSENRRQLEAKVQELQMAQTKVAELQDKCALVEGRLKGVNESLAQEAERRAAAEAQASELAGLRGSLEQELAQGAKAEDQLRRMLEEQKARLRAQDQTLSEDRRQMEAKVQELQTATAMVAELQDKCAAVEGQASELRHELDEQKARLQAQGMTLSEDRSRIEAKAKELQTAQATITEVREKCAAVEGQLKCVNDSLTQNQARLRQEAECRSAAEGQASKLAELRASLERKLAQQTKAEKQMRRELEEKQARLQTEMEAHAEQRGKLESKTKELETAQTTVATLRHKCAAAEEQLKRLNEWQVESRLQLTQEAGRRAVAEDQANQIAAMQSSLQQELTQRTGVEEQLRHELEEQKARLRAQDQTLSEDRSQLAAKVQELQTGTAMVAELQDKCAAVEAQFKGAKESLAQNQAQLSREAERRAAAEGQASELAGLRTSLEQELAQRTKAEEQLRRELEGQKARLQSQGQTLSKGRRQLEAKVQELQTAQTKVAELQDKCAAVEAQFKGAKESLAQNQAQLSREAEHHVAAERQANELAGLRASLEQELAQRTRVEERFRRELEEKQTRLQTEMETLAEQQSKLESKTRELETAQTTVATLRDKCAAAEAQLKSVSEALAQSRVQLAEEAERRSAAESQANGLTGLRSSLEQELEQRTKAEEQLRRELEGQKARLQAQGQTLSEDRRQLAAKVQELQTAQTKVAELHDKCAAVEAQSERLKESLAQNQAQLGREAEHRAAAERQANELAGLRASLEQELAQRTRVEERLRRELEEKQTRLQTEMETLAEQQSKLESKTRELETAQTTVATLRDKCAAAEAQLKSVSEALAQSGAQLAEEAKRRSAAESQATELAALRSSLQQELAQRTRDEQQSQQELGELEGRLQAQAQSLSDVRGELVSKTKELEVVSGELSAARGQIAREALERRNLAAKVIEGERTRAELTEQLADAGQRDTESQQSIQSLESQLQQRSAEHRNLESSYQAEAGERRRLQLHSQNLQATLEDFSNQLKEKTAAQQTGYQREAELQSSVQKLQEQLAESGATSAIQEVEIRTLKEKAQELLLIQSALCARVQELTAKECSLVKSQQALEQQLSGSRSRVQESRRELAALRYAILDGSRLSSELSRGRLQKIRGSVAELGQMATALLHSPLSMAQRGLASSLQGALESWMQTQIDTALPSVSQIEAPVFQSVEFNLLEVTSEAFRMVQQQAVARGIEVQTEASGNAPQLILGDAAHIGQLLRSLPQSLLSLVETKRLGLRVSVEPKLARGAELLVESLVSASNSAQELCERFTTLMAPSETFRSSPTGEGESGLEMCWQLAQALGGTARFEPLTDREVRLLVVLPVEIASPVEVSTIIPACLNEAGDAQNEVQPRCLLSASTVNPSRESEREDKL